MALFQILFSSVLVGMCIQYLCNFLFISATLSMHHYSLLAFVTSFCLLLLLFSIMGCSYTQNILEIGGAHCWSLMWNVFRASCLKKRLVCSPERWWGHLTHFNLGHLIAVSNPHGNNLGLSLCDAYPPHLWNGFPQDINEHTGCMDCSLCHLWFHFCPYVRARSQRIDLYQQRTFSLRS